MRKIFTCLIGMLISTFAVISAVAATDMSPSREMVTVIAAQNQMQAITIATTASPAILVNNGVSTNFVDNQYAEIPNLSAQKMEGTADATLLVVVAMPAEVLEVTGACRQVAS